MKLYVHVTPHYSLSHMLATHTATGISTEDNKLTSLDNQIDTQHGLTACFTKVRTLRRQISVDLQSTSVVWV